MARQQAELGQGYRKPKFNDEVREHFGLVGSEVGEKLLKILDEIPPESYEPPFKLNDPPGCPFIFRSSVLGCEVFFKFQIVGTAKKPLVLFWSCHPSPVLNQERIIMKCFQCEKGKMVSKLADMTAHVRGEEVPVRTEATVCDRCGFQILSDEQSAVYTIASADAYRERHKLLTTKELKEIRQRLGMSFRAFAKYLKVGEASPKRWEAGLVQDEAMDELIRLKADLPSARNNVRQLESRLGLTSTAPIAQVIVVPMPRREATESTWRAPGEPISIGGARFAPGFLKDTCYPA